MDAQPKLEDKGRIKEPQKLEALDLDRKRPTLAKISENLVDRHQAKALAALPKLEEVGSRQAARKAIELAALAEADRGRLQPQGLAPLALAAERRKGPQSAPMLADAAPAAKPGVLSRLAGMLPSDDSRIQMAPKAAPIPRQDRLSALPETHAPAAARRSEAPQEVKKKAVEIEGPLSSRRIVHSSLPSFPDWAREMGLVEAEVQIRFNVDPDGAVADDMRVERTSGYGRLDRLAMEHLKRWRFQPIGGQGREWGLITFRFLLE